MQEQLKETLLREKIATEINGPSENVISDIVDQPKKKVAKVKNDASDSK